MRCTQRLIALRGRTNATITGRHAEITPLPPSRPVTRFALPTALTDCPYCELLGRNQRIDSFGSLPRQAYAPSESVPMFDDGRNGYSLANADVLRARTRIFRRKQNHITRSALGQCCARHRVRAPARRAGNFQLLVAAPTSTTSCFAQLLMHRHEHFLILRPVRRCIELHTSQIGSRSHRLIEREPNNTRSGISGGTKFRRMIFSLWAASMVARHRDYTEFSSLPR